jgi:hypothetical protein
MRKRLFVENTILIYTIAWLGMTVIGIVNGTLRVAGYGKYMDELRAHQLSTVTGIILFGLFVWVLNRRWPIQSAQQAIIIGLIWLALTVAFEFLFGHYVVGHPWSRLFHDYNILAGRVWLLVLIWITVAPYVFYRLSA